MLRLSLTAVVLALAAAGCRTATPQSAPRPAADAGSPDSGYVAYVSGSRSDAVTTPLGGALLAGGGTDSDAGMQWLLAQGGRQAQARFGDVVVLRASGADGYNRYLIDLGAHSVTSIVVTSVAGANSAYVREAIAKAEVVFIAGGDQSRYVRFWQGTALQAAVNARIAAGYPIGGTSAGLAVMGEHVYSSLNLSSTSAALLANPYDSSATFARSLFTVPLLRDVITDSHFVVRNRLGRTIAFLARLQQDGAAAAPRAIAVDEESALGVTADGRGTVFGRGAGVYFLGASNVGSRRCERGVALSLAPVTTYHVPVGANFDLRAWTTAAALPYVLSAVSGVLTSSTGALY